MINEKIYPYPDNKDVYLETFVTDDRRTKPQDAMLIFPGGGYMTVCADREGDFIAFSYLSRGINSFVLHYSTDTESVFPKQLTEAGWAFKYIKENAEKYHINPDRIFVIGFSAGGHLAGSLTVHHKYTENLLSLPENYLKPRGAVLGYAVISAYGARIHKGSFKYLLNKPFDALTNEEKDFQSLEKHITKETPPAFIWHTSEDSCVPPHGSYALAAAYYEAGTPCEVHVFPYGDHGMGLGYEFSSAGIDHLVQPENAGWFDLSVKWILKQ